MTSLDVSFQKEVDMSSCRSWMGFNEHKERSTENLSGQHSCTFPTMPHSIDMHSDWNLNFARSDWVLCADDKTNLAPFSINTIMRNHPPNFCNTCCLFYCNSYYLVKLNSLITDTTVRSPKHDHLTHHNIYRKILDIFMLLSTRFTLDNLVILNLMA